jgi:hypothetical protein
MSSSKDSVLALLNKHAHLMPLFEAMRLAEDFDEAKRESLYYREIVAILSSIFLTDSGETRSPDMFKRPAHKAALNELQQCHAWVVCGPAADSMERLLTKYDAKPTQQ